jgi:hypothetical protein
MDVVYSFRNHNIIYIRAAQYVSEIFPYGIEMVKNNIQDFQYIFNEQDCMKKIASAKRASQ